LFEALESLDYNGPLVGEAKSREWCSMAGRQFAFQGARFGVPGRLGSRAREEVKTIQADAKLRDLLRSRKKVVVLEVVAALAPRQVAKKQGLGEIVKAEIAKVMREAKSRGEAVVFCLGSDSPLTLAEKVYLRQPIGDYGLRCGYLRWRESAGVPWGREKEWDNRVCLCLQMP